MNYKREKDICFLFIKDKISFEDFKLLINGTKLVSDLPKKYLEPMSPILAEYKMAEGTIIESDYFASWNKPTTPLS
jgi:hypothetical protein